MNNEFLHAVNLKVSNFLLTKRYQGSLISCKRISRVVRQRTKCVIHIQQFQMI